MPYSETAQLWGSVKGNAHVLRLMEVAATGNHSVLFVAPPGYGKTHFRRLLSQMGVDNHAEAHRCLCGFYKKDLHRDCTCHPQQIAHQAGRLRKLVARYDMLAEPSRPKWPEIITKENEPFARVWERIQASQKQPVPTGIEPGATKLLETAYARLSLVPGSVFKIIAVAHTIARMGRHETVQAPDMAEAIQYRVE